MPLSPIQNQQVKYIVTQTDINNGWAAVPIVWSEPFSDADYTCAYGIYDLDGTIDVSFICGDQHNKTFEGWDAIVYMGSAIPLIQGQEDVVNQEVVNPIVFTASAQTLYQVTFYYGPSGATGSGTWSPVVTWQDPSGNNLTLAYPYLGPATAGDVNNYQSYSIPFFVKAGTSITVTGTYSGSPFPLNVALRVVQMPNNATVPSVGDQFIVNAMAAHN